MAAGKKERGPGWLAGLTGLGILAVGAFVALGGLPLLKGGNGAERELEASSATASSVTAAHPGEAARSPSAREAIEAADVAAHRMRIAEGGRLALDLDDYPGEAPLRFALDLSDEARGSGDREVRVVSEQGVRIDTTASVLPGAGSGVLLELEPSALASGRYMIQIETMETSHPFRIRRYVLEVE